MESPDGYQEPDVAYLVEFEGGGELGGFTTLSEAERLIALANGEGPGVPPGVPLHINMVPLHARLEDWEHDR